jgi:putative ABC transport system ATP-binding protein
MSYIVADQLIKQYGHGEAAVVALSEVSFEIAAGEFIAVMGASGSGKSTLLSILGAMNSPTCGSLRVDGIDVYRLSHDQRSDFRREFLGFVFQSFHLVPYLTVLENVLLPLAIVKADKARRHEMAAEALRQVGLENKIHRLPGQISGGESERVAIARAIVNEPPVLLADEPTGNLDSRTSRDIMELLQRLNNAGMTIVMVTHSAECAQYAERVLRVSDGRLLAN